MRHIKFSPPDISQEEIDEVVDTLRGDWITTGPKTKKLENIIASFCHVSKAVCLNSQTACAELTLRLLGVGPGDEVIVPSYTYTATCSVVLHVGATPVMIDISKDSLEMDYEALKEALNERTKVIIPVDLAGIPCDYDKIYKIVEEKRHLFKANSEIQKVFGRIIIMSDAAHSLGATYKAIPTGALGDFSCFSFHAVKNLTTAEGGAVTWKDHDGLDNEYIYKQYQLLSLHGQNKSALEKSKASSWEYDVVGAYYKCNLTDLAASLGLAQMRRYEGMLKRRYEIVNKYNEAFSNLNIKVLPHFSDKHISSCHLYIVRLNDFTMEQRNEFIEKMAQNGVACNVHYKPLPMLTAYKNLGYNIADYPNAYEAFKNSVTLPLHTRLSDEDVDYIIATFKEVYLSFKKYEKVK